MPQILTLIFLGTLLGAAHAEQPKLRVCTGTQGDNYHRVGMELKAALKGSVDVQVIPTRGSWENLEGIDAEPTRCDAIMAQDDAYALYQFEHPKSKLMMERLTVLYPEYVHLLCNRKAGIKNLLDLDPKKHTVLTHVYGSGTFITWSLISRLSRGLAKIKTAEAPMDAGLLKIADGVEAQCLVLVLGLGGRTLKAANDQFGDQLTLIPVHDPNLHQRVGRERRIVYADAKIVRTTYPKLLVSDVATQVVNAVFFLSPEWRARYPQAARKLVAALIARASSTVGDQ